MFRIKDESEMNIIIFKVPKNLNRVAIKKEKSSKNDKKWERKEEECW